MIPELSKVKAQMKAVTAIAQTPHEAMLAHILIVAYTGRSEELAKYSRELILERFKLSPPEAIKLIMEIVLELNGLGLDSMGVSGNELN